MNKFGTIKSKLLSKLTESYASENKAEIKDILTTIKENKNFKEINLAAAQKGLDLFSEHTAEAKKNPGSHPNIDRLINIVKTNGTLRVEIILR